MRALNHIRRIGGGQSEPHLFVCDDERLWVLKLPGNPQAHQLAADFIGLNAATALRVPVVVSQLVVVDEAALATMNPRPDWVRPGMALGTRFVERSTLMTSALLAASNVNELAALFVCDIWLETLDRMRPDGQWNLLRLTSDDSGSFVALDFGYSLNAQASLGDVPLVPASYPVVIRQLISPAALASALQDLTALNTSAPDDWVRSVPSEWLDVERRVAILSFLAERRARIQSADIMDLLEARL